MEEEQVHAVPLGSDPQATLPAHEREVPAKLEQGLLEMTQQGVLKIRLRVLVPESKKLQHHRVFQFLLRPRPSAGRGRGRSSRRRSAGPWEHRALVERGRDLAVKLPHEPSVAWLRAYRRSSRCRKSMMRVCWRMRISGSLTMCVPSIGSSS